MTQLPPPYPPDPYASQGQYPPQQYPPQGQYPAPQYPAVPDPYAQPQYPAGQDPYGQPQYPPGPDPYAQPGQYPPVQQQYQPGVLGYPPARVGTNGFAVAALVFGVIGGVVLSVIFGIVALVQIPKRNQKGKGLAVTGLVLSALWVVGIAGLVAVILANDATRDDTGAISGSGDVGVTQLKPGDCFNGLAGNEEITSVPAVPCAEPHEGEVFAVFNLSGQAFPGDQAVFDQGEKGCNDRLEGYSVKAVDDPSVDLYVLHPTRESWATGDHEVTCIIGNPDEKRTGSLKD